MKVLRNFLRRHSGAVINEEISKDYFLNEIQNPQTEVSPELTLESLNLSKLQERPYHIQMDDTVPVVNTQRHECIELNTKNFNEEQKNILITIVGEILPGVTAENLAARIQPPFSH